MTNFNVSVDVDIDAAYISLSGKEISVTRELAPDVLIDLDEFGVVSGIELTSVAAEVPMDKLVEKFHLHSEDRQVLQTILLSLKQAQFQSGGEGLSALRTPVFVPA